MHELYFTSIVFLSSRRVEWTISWPWKVMLKIWPQVKVMTWPEKVMLHISRSASSSWTHLWWFHRSSWSLSKVIPEKLLVTFHDLKWPWRHDEGSSVAIFRLRVSVLPLTRCSRVFWMVFVQKRRLSFFSHWLIQEKAQSAQTQVRSQLAHPPTQRQRRAVGKSCSLLYYVFLWCFFRFFAVYIIVPILY